MKKLISIGILLLVLAFSAAAKQECTTIQSGELLYADGHYLNGTPLMTGFDPFGYNYQGHMFSGSYANAYLGRDGFPPYLGDTDTYLAEYPSAESHWTWPYRDDSLIMKWNDAWLSNKDCDGDGTLDRHYDLPSYIGSGAWLTNHQWGSYESQESLLGDWVITFDFGSPYVHDMTITDEKKGILSGIGGYPSPGPYTHDWTMTGLKDGDNVEMTITYETGNPGYEVYMVGSINEDGSMGGTCETSSGQVCTWETNVNTLETCDWTYFVKIVAVPEDAVLNNSIWYAADGTEIGPAIWGEFAIIQEVENDPCADLHGVQYLSPLRAGLGDW